MSTDLPGIDNWIAPDPPEGGGVQFDGDPPEKCQGCHEYDPNLTPVEEGHGYGDWLCPKCHEKLNAKHRTDGLNAALERLRVAMESIPPEVMNARRLQYEASLKQRRDYHPKATNRKPKKNWRGKETANWR